MPRLFSAVALARKTPDQEAPELTRRADDIVIDGLPWIAALARSALLAAERVLVPVQPSPYDLWASAEMVALIREAQLFRPALHAAFVINWRAGGGAADPYLHGQEKVLQVRGVLALLMFAAFNIFWSALVLPLSAPPYDFAHTVIGAFGLVGVVGALAAARAGQWVDRGHDQRTTAVALVALLLAWWPLSLMGSSLWALVIGIVLLDLGGRALHVTNQSLIFRNRPEAHSRLVGVYMLFYAVGSGLGAISTTITYAHAGWQGVGLLGATVSLVVLPFWWMTKSRLLAAAMQV